MSASHLEFRKSLDGFKGPQDSQNSEGLYRLDVSSFVVSVDIGNVALRNIAAQSDLCTQTSTKTTTKKQ